MKNNKGMGVIEIIILIALAVMLGLGISALLFGSRSRAQESELLPVQITAYCLSGVTASGEQTHEGGCAFRKDLIGRRVNIYSQNMELLGTFTINDTGGKRIRQGKTIDVWQPDRKSCYRWTQPGYVEILPEETEEQVNDLIENGNNGTDSGDGNTGADQERQE